MKIETVCGNKIESSVIEKYFSNMVNMYFKILPMYEDNSESIISYMENLRDEMIGYGGLINSINEDPMFVSLIANLQYMIDGMKSGDIEKASVKKKVFNAISMCNKLSLRYGKGGCE